MVLETKILQYKISLVYFRRSYFWVITDEVRTQASLGGARILRRARPLRRAGRTGRQRASSRR